MAERATSYRACPPARPCRRDPNDCPDLRARAVLRKRAVRELEQHAHVLGLERLEVIDLGPCELLDRLGLRGALAQRRYRRRSRGERRTQRPVERGLDLAALEE